ncbi:hint-domain-containing protein [Xylaria sp. FL1777]|nr:hint-domain-containing protein [Xylaria sp. FL1777]
MKTKPENPYPTKDSDSESIAAATLASDDPVITIHPLESKDGVLVRVQPPEKPLDPTPGHVPCDIVLVIDVSSSMSDDAPASVNDKQGKAKKEHFGLTVLDLTKHAARTILSGLDERDRLGIVTFGYEAKVVQVLAPMTQARKKELSTRIDSIYAEGPTNLWGGITKGLELFEDGGSSGRVPALMVLTDGQPNYMCPPQGYVRKLQTMSPLPAAINTFGFGYEIRSGLLKSIAETCNGNYAFIPDAGMIGTVFVHAVAHLITTYATRCTLEISAPEGMLLKSTTGKSITTQQDGNERVGSSNLTIQLGNLQYGQSRDIYLENVDELGKHTTYNLAEEERMMHATLKYSRQSVEYDTFADQDMLEPSSLPSSVVAYHQSRSIICDLLSSFASITNFEYADNGHVEDMEEYRTRLQKAIDNIPAKNYEDKHNRSLIQDLDGQISEALSKPEYFNRWGRHYFFSLWNAHEKQLCNSFRDPGPLMYNDSAFFIGFRDELDNMFNVLPPPKPSNRARSSGGILRTLVTKVTKVTQSISMSMFNNPENPCFAAASPVLLAAGNEVPICTLQRGMSVQTPLGPRRVQALLKTQSRGAVAMCRVGNLLVTPWHPVKIDQSENEHEHCDETGWVFPVDVVKSTEDYFGSVYSVLLEPDGDVDAHAMRIGGVWGVTLGHGIIKGGDTRAHQFLGDYNGVSKQLVALGSDEYGVYCCAGVKRDHRTGRVCGFEHLPAVHAKTGESMDRVGLHTKLEICA